MLRIVGFYLSDEMKAAIAFLRWQHGGKLPVVTIDPKESLKAGEGSAVVVLFDGQEQLAVGFWGIVRHYQDKGLVLC